MNNRLTPKNMFLVGANPGWLVALGIVFIILGCVAISAASFTTILSVIFIGVLITVGGAIILVDTFKSWWGKWSVFFWHLVLGILYVAAGTLLINSPVLGSVSITLFLGVFYVIVGIFRLVSAASLKMTRWGWNFFNGLVTLILGVLILANWPASSLFIIGLFVGIDLLVAGWAYVMMSLAAKQFVK